MSVGKPGPGAIPPRQDSLYFNLMGAAKLCFNYLNRHVDPATGFAYMWTYLLTNPPKASHQGWDLVEESGRALEALVPLRLMTGQDTGLDRELWLRDKLVELLDRNNGLIHRPQTAYANHVADIYDQSSALLGLVMRYLAEGDTTCEEAIDLNVAALAELAEWDGDEYARFQCVAVRNGKALADYGKLVTETDNPEAVDDVWLGRFIMPLTLYAKASGKQRPLVFARALARHVALRSGGYGSDGSFSRIRHGEDALWSYGHFHSRSHTLAGILRLAHAVGDGELADWAERGFRWALTQGTAFGWFPEFIGRKNIEAEGCETCGVVDMLDMAIQLARFGKTEYWEVADRIWRNQLLEAQLRDVSWVKSGTAMRDTEIDTFQDVPERARGGFAGWSGVNDLISDYEDPYFSSLDRSQDHRRTLMGCCAAAGPRGLYLAWHNALEPTREGVTVHFALSRDSDKATLRSFEPYEGLIEVQMKTPGSLHVDVPGKPATGEVALEVNGEAAKANWEGSQLHIPRLKEGDTVRVHYPLNETTETVTVGGKDFTTAVDYEVTWRGNTVIQVRPGGRYCPLYRREGARGERPESAPPTGAVPAAEIDF